MADVYKRQTLYCVLYVCVRARTRARPCVRVERGRQWEWERDKERAVKYKRRQINTADTNEWNGGLL